MNHYIIIEPGLTGLKKWQILSQQELDKAKVKYQYSSRHTIFTYQKLRSKI